MKTPIKVIQTQSMIYLTVKESIIDSRFLGITSMHVDEIVWMKALAFDFALNYEEVEFEYIQLETDKTTLQILELINN
jgi:hypothetical protein